MLVPGQPDLLEELIDEASDIAVLKIDVDEDLPLERVDVSREEAVSLLTARGQTRDRDMAERAGVSRFMTKPFSNSEVLATVRELLAQASSAPGSARARPRAAPRSAGRATRPMNLQHGRRRVLSCPI